jgi:hypothetical protein
MPKTNRGWCARSLPEPVLGSPPSLEAMRLDDPAFREIVVKPREMMAKPDSTANHDLGDL